MIETILILSSLILLFAIVRRRRIRHERYLMAQAWAKKSILPKPSQIKFAIEAQIQNKSSIDLNSDEGIVGFANFWRRKWQEKLRD